MRHVHLTLSALKTLVKSPPSGTKIILWDPLMPGLGAYKTGSGRISFVYQYKMPRRKSRSVKLGELHEIGIAGARDLAADLAHQRRRGMDPIAERRRLAKEDDDRQSLVLSVYAAEYLARRIEAGRALTTAQTKIVTRDVVGQLGHIRIDKMKVDDVERFAKALGDRGPSARRIGLVYLNTILNDAVRREKIGRNPAKNVEIPKAGERDRRLREDELQRLLEAAHDIGDARGAVLTILVRLLKRKEEIAAMTWEEIDLTIGRWTLGANRTKNDETKGIVLPHQVIDLMIAQQPDPKLRKGFVFSLDGGRTSPEMGGQVKDLIDANMHRRLDLANERAGTALSVAHFTIHDLRTTGASRLQEKPFLVPTAIIDTILLHTIGNRITRKYQRSPLDVEAGDALQVWNDHVDELMSGPAAWPGGRSLPKMKPAERDRRLKEFRKDWPLRTDQKRAKAREERDGVVSASAKRKRSRQANRPG